MFADFYVCLAVNTAIAVFTAILILYAVIGGGLWAFMRFMEWWDEGHP